MTVYEDCNERAALVAAAKNASQRWAKSAWWAKSSIWRDAGWSHSALEYEVIFSIWRQAQERERERLFK